MLVLSPPLSGHAARPSETTTRCGYLRDHCRRIEFTRRIARFPRFVLPSNLAISPSFVHDPNLILIPVFISPEHSENFNAPSPRHVPWRFGHAHMVVSGFLAAADLSCLYRPQCRSFCSHRVLNNDLNPANRPVVLPRHPDKLSSSRISRRHARLGAIPSLNPSAALVPFPVLQPRSPSYSTL